MRSHRPESWRRLSGNRPAPLAHWKGLLTWSLCVLLFGTYVVPASAARLVRTRTKTSPIKEKDIAWRTPVNNQAQTWILWAWNDKGYLVTAFMISTKFLFTTRIGVQLTIRTPSGDVHHEVKEYTLDKLKASQKTLSMKVASKHAWVGGLTKGTVKADFGDWAASLQYTRTLPGFRAMGGPMLFRKKIFEGIPFAPRLKVQGTIKIKGKKLSFQGTGYADYSLQTIVPRRLARRWYAMRATNAKYTIIATQLWTSKRWRPSSLPTLSIAAGKKWLYHGMPRTIKFKASRVRVDAKARYNVPMHVVYRCKADDGTRYHVDIVHKVQYARLDLMSHINPVLRFILQRLLSRPFVFRYRAKVRLKIKRKGKTTISETIKGYSEWMFVQ